MRFFAGLICCVWFVTAPVRAAEAPFHLHLLGPEAIAAHADAGKIKDILGLEESRSVGSFLVGNVAKMVNADFAGTAENTAAGLAAIFQLGLGHELVIEIVDRKAGHWRAALRVPGTAKTIFMETLRQFVKKHGGKIKTPVDGMGSWSFVPKGGKRALLVSHHGEWVFLDHSDEEQPSAWRQEALKKQRPVASLDGPAHLRCRSDYLTDLIPGLQLPHAFTLNLSLRFHHGRLRTEGTVDFDSAVKLPLEPFTIPTNSLRDPLITFSAARGFRGWLADWKALPQWRLPALPNQAFGWAHEDLPMHSLAAFPFPAVAKYLKRQTARVKETLNPDLAKRGLGELVYVPDDAGQVLRGVPLMAPFFVPAPEPSGDWALVGTVVGNRPTGPNTNPPPAELLGQIQNRPDLIYYHWEITQPRLTQLQMLTSLVRVFAMKFASTANDPFPLWIKNVAPSLGNTVTEITRASDRRWEVTRTSDFGLTALELTLLGHRLAPVVTLPSPAGLPTR